MSLIEEALRRVQEVPKNAPPATAPPAKAPPAPDAPAHPWPVTTAPSAQTPKLGSQPQPIARLILMGVLVGIIAWWWRDAAGRKPAHHPSQEVLSSTAQPQPAASPPPGSLLSNRAAHAQAERTMVLSGVVVGVGAPYAVIDGHIVGLGEQVGEATVKEITPRTVTLRLADGNETTLQVPR